MYDKPSDYKNSIIISIDITLGYAYFMDKEHPLASKIGRVYYHRHIGSIKVDRWLTPTEIVHHIDDDKINNDPENLLITDNKDHGTIHALRDGKMIKKEKVCPTCKSKFMSINEIYCSKKCVKREGITNEVSSDDLKKLVWTYPSTKVAEMLGVSDIAIGKRCKRLGIVKPGRGYWAKINGQLAQ